MAENYTNRDSQERNEKWTHNGPGELPLLSAFLFTSDLLGIGFLLTPPLASTLTSSIIHDIYQVLKFMSTLSCADQLKLSFVAICNCPSRIISTTAHVKSPSWCLELRRATYNQLANASQANSKISLPNPLKFLSLSQFCLLSPLKIYTHTHTLTVFLDTSLGCLTSRPTLTEFLLIPETLFFSEVWFSSPKPTLSAPPVFSNSTYAG